MSEDAANETAGNAAGGDRCGLWVCSSGLEKRKRQQNRHFFGFLFSFFLILIDPSNLPARRDIQSGACLSLPGRRRGGEVKGKLLGAWFERPPRDFCSKRAQKTRRTALSEALVVFLGKLRHGMFWLRDEQPKAPAKGNFLGKQRFGARPQKRDKRQKGRDGWDGDETAQPPASIQASDALLHSRLQYLHYKYIIFNL